MYDLSNIGLMSLDELASRYGNYKSVNSQKSDFINLLCIKFDVTTNLQAIERMDSALGHVDGVLDFPDEHGFMDLDDDAISLARLFSDLDPASMVTSQEYWLTCTLNTGHTITFGLVKTDTPSVIGSNSLIFFQDNSNFAVRYISDTLGHYNEYAVYNAPIIDNQGEEVNFDSIAQCLSDQVAVNNVVSYIADNIPMTGTVSVDKIQNGLSAMGNSIADKAVQALGNAGELSAKSGLSIIYALISENGSGTYDEGDDFYNPVEKPGYTTNYIGLIVTSLFQVLSTVMLAFFAALRAIAVVLSALFSALGTMLDSIIGINFSSDVNKISSQPAFNFPLTKGRKMSISQLQAKFWLEDDKIEAIKDELKTKGCASFDVSGIISVLILTAAIDDNGEVSYVYIQFMAQCNPLGVEIDSSFPMTNDQNDYTIDIGDNAVHDVIHPWYDDVNANPDTFYFAASDTARKRVAIMCWLFLAEKMQYLLMPNVCELTHPFSGSIPSTFDSYVASLDSLNYTLTDDQGNLIDTTTEAGIAKHVIWRIRFVVGSIHKILSYNLFDDLSSLSWENVIKIYTWLYEADHSYIPYLHWNEIITPAVGDGLLSPVVEFPNASLSALITNFVLITLAAVGAAVAVQGTKRVLQRRAVAKLHKREKDYELAAKAYKAYGGQTPENAKALYKANKKLGRSWNWAGKVGVKSVNGFDTGASSTPVSTLLDTNRFANDVSETTDNSFLDVNNLIIGLIRGS